MGELKKSYRPGIGYLIILIVGIFLALVMVRLYQSGFTSSGVSQVFSLESILGKSIASLAAALAAWFILRRLGRRIEQRES